MRRMAFASSILRARRPLDLDTLYDIVPWTSIEALVSYRPSMLHMIISRLRCRRKSSELGFSYADLPTSSRPYPSPLAFLWGVLPNQGHDLELKKRIEETPRWEV